MTTLDARQSALVLVDYQSRLMPSIHDADVAVEHAVFLARVANELGVPVFGTEENPTGLGHNDERIAALCATTLAKRCFDACADGLVDCLRTDRRVEQVVVAGCEAHVCLLQTALGLLEEELDVWVVTDACSSRSERSRDAAFDRLAAAGAELVTTEMVAFEWLRDAGHPRFKEVLSIVN